MENKNNEKPEEKKEWPEYLHYSGVANEDDFHYKKPGLRDFFLMLGIDIKKNQIQNTRKRNAQIR